MRNVMLVVATATTAAAATTAGYAQVERLNTPDTARAHLEIRYVRDSEEYAVLSRMVYRAASRAVEAAARQVPRGQPWAVVLDADETVLDNSTQELERAAYGELDFHPGSWNAWVARREAGAVPGAREFLALVRRLGGRIAYVTNRGDMTREDTRANLEQLGLWGQNDRLCLLTADAAYTKAVRRQEIVTGVGACAWSGDRVNVLAFVGDQLGDFPAAGEGDQDAGRDEAFGVRYFLIPNPMYGSWERRVTRRR